MSHFQQAAIVESGSGANGRYVKWADGTMICWSSSLSLTADATTGSGSIFRSAETTWTLPASFVDTNYAVHPCGVGAATHWCNARADTTSAAVFVTFAAASTAARPVRLTAIGRWF